MKKYIFIFVAAVVLALMTLPTFMATEQAPPSEMELESGSVFSAESNPLLMNTQSPEGLETGVATEEEVTSITGETVNIVPIPNAEGDVVGENIPNAVEGDFEAVNIPFNGENQDVELGEGVTIKGTNTNESSLNIDSINGM